MNAMNFKNVKSAVNAAKNALMGRILTFGKCILHGNEILAIK